MASPINIPSEVKDTLVQFETQYLTGMQSMPASWLSEGDVIVTSKLGPAFLKARFPIPVQAAEYKAALGPTEHRKLSEKFKDVDYAFWSDGVSELLDVLRSNQFTGWGQTAMAWVRALVTLKQKRAMAALEAGLTTENWDGPGINFFDENHPWNPVKPKAGEVNNNTMYSMTVSNTNLDAIAQRFREFKGPNGEDMGMELSGLIYPRVLQGSFENIILPSNVANQTASDGTNPGRWRGRIWGRPTAESSQATTYYALATNRPDITPLLGCSKMAPGSIAMNTGTVTEGGEVETEIDDMSSQLYKDIKHVGIKKTVRYQASTGHHLAIIRCSTAAKP